MAGYSFLDWDSDFFGKKVGRIDALEHTSDSLGQVLDQARGDGMEVLYWFAKPQEQSKAAAAGRGNLIDRKRTYLRDVSQFFPMELAVNHFISSYKEAEADAELNALALTAGEFSRFRLDPGFGQTAFEKLYLRWMQNSVSREIAEEVLYIDFFGKKVAMLTLGLKNGRPDIGLVSADPAHQGEGLGGDLVRSAIVWAINRDYKEIQVVTQGENEAACRFYEKLNFAVEKEEWVYHFWL